MANFGYCTDCEELTRIGLDGRGSCGHGRVIRLPDMISRAEADRQTREAVAAVLMEAVGKVNEACDGSLSLQSRSDEDCAYDDGVREGCAAAIHAIRALAPDAVAILAKWGAREKKLQDAVDAIAPWLSASLSPKENGGLGSDAGAEYRAACELVFAAAIREEK